MLKLIFSRPQSTAAQGWIVEASIPAVGTKHIVQRMFAVGAADSRDAERIAREALGNLHCTIRARIKLAPGMMATLNVAVGSVQELDGD